MRKIIFLFLSLAFLPAFALASPHTVIAPHCLPGKIKADYQTLAKSSKLALIDIDATGITQLSQARHDPKSLCGGFMDVTEAFQANKLSAAAFLKAHEYPSQARAPHDYQIQYPDQVNQLLKQVNAQAMWDSLTRMTQFKDRYANSATGVDTANWIKAQIEAAALAQHRNDVHVYFIPTPRYQQPSVVAVMGDATKSGIVIGAHMDTLSASWSNKPGADDDGSGSVVVLETARALIASGMTFKKPLYFIFYAAEEEGLVGSNAVVAAFRKQHIPVDAVLHFDMTGYDYKNEDTLWLMDDYVNPALVSYISELITHYVKKPVKHSRCGYACSDHASWTQGGYAAAIPAEASYAHTNPAMHSANDTMDKLSLTHMTDYLKLATAFAVEMAEPNN